MKIITTLFLIALSFKGFTQIEKGKWLVGGNASFTSSKSKTLKMTSLQLSPAAGYFFINNTVGGLRLNYGYETFNYTRDKLRVTNILLSPFIRYYFLPSEQSLNFFADASYGYGKGKYRELTFPSSHSFSFSTFSLMAGPSFFLNQHTALELTFGYTHSTRGAIDTTSTNSFRVGVGLQFHL